MAGAHNTERPNSQYTFSLLLSELKNESVEFVRTRAQLFVSELRDKAGTSRKSALFAAAALIFAGVAFLLFTLSAVGLVAIAFWGSPFAFFWGFLIIGVLYLLLGAINSIIGYYALTGLAPQKTIKVLRDDKSWVRAGVSRQC